MSAKEDQGWSEESKGQLKKGVEILARIMEEHNTGDINYDDLMKLQESLNKCLDQMKDTKKKEDEKLEKKGEEKDKGGGFRKESGKK